MGCSCRGGARAGARTASGATVTGYRYTSPTGEVKPFLTSIEAKAEQRRNGGGTIVQLTSGT